MQAINKSFFIIRTKGENDVAVTVKTNKQQTEKVNKAKPRKVPYLSSQTDTNQVIAFTSLGQPHSSYVSLVCQPNHVRERAFKEPQHKLTTLVSAEHKTQPKRLLWYLTARVSVMHGTK